MRRFFYRLCLATVIYGAMALIISSIHDYPLTRQHLQKLREHDLITEQRQWINTFYFINETASGLKFLLTGNEKHMHHYPSPSHLLAARKQVALAGDWEMQIVVGQMYLIGKYAPVDIDEGMRWLKMARDNAPVEHREKIIASILQAETHQQQNLSLP